MRHNNPLPLQHRPKCHGMYKLWFNQAGRKARRRTTRQEKARAVFPRPVDGAVRPAVPGMTNLHNGKVRSGRGFTPAELKKCGLTAPYARTIGIAVDLRRTNKSEAVFERNVKRLQTYMDRLVIIKKGEDKKAFTQVRVALPVVREDRVFETREISDAEKKKCAYSITQGRRKMQKIRGRLAKKTEESE
ncbi:Ribosomal protein L13e like protein [Aduncisulcus paluster]|uniref:Ribosomal protein L13e like protein n=1 Tax=Aduncisulcus paluster TaxID=2918883 RepID=A0ABQ5K724_9EUKA|nr:Ribosomal protein L13e like protein [Aduncisulcus paluster]|eukprot:gnl/Carplike_NY0171/239_a345_5083.p1 GENE.gnl/Carplike_NY0171/239_a345_5083~~gnl/Carplike_NY0171/239_a345_5083.p1  ORF type:complete len:189 (+),score=73.00 gnl/Carplike_NY0171/239_a345_5083:44-610(+)